jgi:hypothetical protein
VKTGVGVLDSPPGQEGNFLVTKQLVYQKFVVDGEFLPGKVEIRVDPQILA